eukprot:GFYU01007709.1.p1 GENE.GFYU01007709.1~~GFYU01007709.1.p1  ORF type:complete len:294 (+),score=65.67 GFYU01007709.1:217-1098(+)
MTIATEPITEAARHTLPADASKEPLCLYHSARTRSVIQRVLNILREGKCPAEPSRPWLCGCSRNAATDEATVSMKTFVGDAVAVAKEFTTLQWMKEDILTKESHMSESIIERLTSAITEVNKAVPFDTWLRLAVFVTKSVRREALSDKVRGCNRRVEVQESLPLSNSEEIRVLIGPKGRGLKAMKTWVGNNTSLQISQLYVEDEALVGVFLCEAGEVQPLKEESRFHQALVGAQSYYMTEAYSGGASTHVAGELFDSNGDPIDEATEENECQDGVTSSLFNQLLSFAVVTKKK